MTSGPFSEALPGGPGCQKALRGVAPLARAARPRCALRLAQRLLAPRRGRGSYLDRLRVRRLAAIGARATGGAVPCCLAAAAAAVATVLASRPGLPVPLLRAMQRVLTGSLLERLGLEAGTGRKRRGRVGPLLRASGQPRYSPSLPGAGRRVPMRRGRSVFVEPSPPADADLQAVLDEIVRRVVKMLERRGALAQKQNSNCLAAAHGESADALELRSSQPAIVRVPHCLRAPHCDLRVGLAR